MPTISLFFSGPQCFGLASSHSGSVEPTALQAGGALGRGIRAPSLDKQNPCSPCCTRCTHAPDTSSEALHGPGWAVSTPVHPMLWGCAHPLLRKPGSRRGALLTPLALPLRSLTARRAISSRWSGASPSPSSCCCSSSAPAGRGSWTRSGCTLWGQGWSVQAQLPSGWSPRPARPVHKGISPTSLSVPAHKA